MALDPCAKDWSERLNRFTPADLPPEPPGTKARPQKILVRAEDFAEAMEGVEQLVYCCESPDLQWTGDPDYPGVECRKCGYVVAVAGSVALNLVTDETATNRRREPDSSDQRRFTEPADEEIREDDNFDASDAKSSTEGDSSDPPHPVVETPRRKPSQPLSTRLIFQSHMTDLVRAFGYETLSQEEARKRAEPLIEKYGRERISAAAVEVVEEVANPPRHFRLSDEARRLSVQILGRPPAPDSGAKHAVAADDTGDR